MKNDNTYWNHGKETITIVTNEEPDAEWGRGYGKGTRFFIGPGEGINLDILKLKPFRPESTNKEKSPE